MGKQDFGARVIVALANHEIAQQRVEDLSKRIAEAMGRCPETVKALSADLTDANQALYFDQKGRVKNHLWAAYNSESVYGERIDPEGQHYLLHPSNGGCRHCLGAWLLINRRKECRQELGNAKRAIRALGKSAMKHEGLEFGGARI